MADNPAKSAAAPTGAPAGALDRIFVADLVEEVEIGAFDQERGVRQRLRFNVEVEVAPPAADIEDNADMVISYDRIVAAIRAVAGGERIDLLETFAEVVAELCLVDPRAARAHVRIEKLDRIEGSLGVQIVRSRSGGGAMQDGLRHRLGIGSEAPAPPVLIQLSGAVVFSNRLPEWVAAIRNVSAPLVVAPGGGRLAAAVLETREALGLDDRAAGRMAVLAMQQAAIALAAQDPHLTATDTVTAIEAALDAGEAAVWSPAKLPEAEASAGWIAAPETIALRLAAQMGVRRLVFVRATESGGASMDAVPASEIDRGFAVALHETEIEGVVLNVDEAGSLGAAVSDTLSGTLRRLV